MFSREPKLAPRTVRPAFSLTGTNHPCIAWFRNYHGIPRASICWRFSFLAADSMLNPLESALPNKHRVLSGFGRSLRL
jgi:hypothetical protein